MFAIYKRELKAYFNSFIGFLFLGISLFFIGMYYTIYQLVYASPFFAQTISAVIIIFMISVPVLCMKVFAEERHNKTDQLTLTAPVTVGQIVVGKYLALLTIFGIATLIICIYPIILTFYGEILVGETYVAILGYFLYGMTAIAIGVLVSALTESQMIAAVLGFVALFLGYIMGDFCSMISAQGNLLTKILGMYDLSAPFTQLLNGILDLKSVLYFITVSGVALFLTTQIIQKRRYTSSVKHISMGAYSTGMIAIVAALAVLVNVFVAQLPATWTVVDFSKEQLYSITDESKEFIKNVDKDVEIFVMVAEDKADPTVAYTLSYYNDLSENITVTYIDPSLNPTFASQYTDDSILMNSLIIKSDLRHKVVNFLEMWVFNSDGSSIVGYDGEGEISSAISYVLSTEEPVVYMTQGHGEGNFSEEVNAAFAKQNIQHENINLMEYDAVPDNAFCLFIYAPEKDFSSDDAQKVINYLESGGTVVFVAGTADVKRPNCDKILDYMGLQLSDGLIIDANTSFYYQNQLQLLPDIADTDYTINVYSDDAPVYVPYAQAIAITGKEQYTNYTGLLQTSQKSFMKADKNSTSLVEESNDISGPFSVGLEARKVMMDAIAVMVVYSSSQMFNSASIDVSSGTNQQLLIDTIIACIGDDFAVSIPAKSYQVDYIMVNQTHAVLIGIVVSVLIPLACLISGFVIWFKRRRK